MHHTHQASDCCHHPLCGGTKTLRSSQPETPGYRLKPDAIESRSGQGTQGSIRTNFTKALDRTENLLERVSANQLSIPWNDTRCATQWSGHSEGCYPGGRQGPDQQARYATYDAPLLCDGTFGSWSGLDGHKQTVGAQQLHNNNGLFALPQAAPLFGTESLGLAAGQTMPALGRSQLADRFAKIEAQAAAGADAVGTATASGVAISSGGQSAQDQAKPQKAQLTSGTDPLSVLGIVRRYTESYVTKFFNSLSAQVESTLVRLGFCRTADLGSRNYQCNGCDYSRTVYNSCGDRNCPQCSGARRSTWLDKTTKLIEPEVTYFQVVATLPDKLSPLTLGNREEVYHLLYSASWEVLKAKIEKDVGIQAAAAGVLHTWNQRLEHHPHIHFVVPGNGPSIDGTKWIDCRMTKGTLSEPSKPFLVDNKELGREFRDLFLKRLSKKIEQGIIVPVDAVQIATIINELSKIDWVIFIQGPPRRDCGGELVLKYLTRYMTGGPISNKRIIKEQDGRIFYWVRNKDKSGGREEYSLPGVTFVQQWCLHILPKEFTRSRFFGAWSNTKRKSYKATVARLLEPGRIEVAKTFEEAESSAATKSEQPKRNCPCCEGELVVVSQAERPKWRELFYGPAHPWWYEWTSLGKRPPS